MNIAFEQSALEFNDLTNALLTEKKIKLSIARLDKLHADVSGNKLFKLHYFLQAAISKSNKKIITSGGAYSNHLVATAYASHALGLEAIGIVRRETHEADSHTILRCRELGMQLQFVSRSIYKQIADESFLNEIKLQHGDCTIIPEGGYHKLGAQGASLIMDRLKDRIPSHVCVAVGTATTLAGLVSEANSAKIIGVPVLKNFTDVFERVFNLTGLRNPAQLAIMNDYHFGGYARSSDILKSFMNNFFDTYQIPLDFVYTAKMMYAVMDKINQGYFAAGSNIICLHTGGLQGNKSLPPNYLTF